MKLNLFNSAQRILQFSKSVKKVISLKSLKIKPVIIPSVMMGTYFFFYQKKMFNTQSLYSLENFRKFYLEGCDTLQEGEMKEVKWGTKENQSILVVKYGGKLRAMSNYCPHFGAPLHTGILVDNVVKCPWHGASFDVTTGKTDISPSIDDLTYYEVNEDGQGFYVHLPDDVKASVRPRMCKRDPDDKRKFLIVGGGPAGLSAAETLRQNGYTGEIVILSKDQYAPYDRTMLTKWIPPTVNKIYLRSPDFLKEYDIDVVNGASVAGVDNQNKKVQLADGTEVSYDKLLLATGGSPAVPRIPGTDKSHVHVLRTFDDLKKIDSACKNAKDIVIVGGSFLGMESASVLKKSFGKANVTVIEMNATPFASTLGKEVGYALQK
jgi:nitrite reductase/ring-hydroxylating ferredoxin subunit